MEKILSEKIEKLEIQAGDIPITVIRPEKYSINRKTIFYYHGWTSNVENYELFGEIFASKGYQVIMPEINNHGKRGTTDYDSYKTMFDVLVQSVAEFSAIKEIAEERLNADINNLVVAGHSLGGMIASSVFTIHTSIKLGLIFNSIFDIEIIMNNMDEEFADSERDSYLLFNPMARVEYISGRNMEIFIGEEDLVIPKEGMEKFERELKNSEIKRDKINFNYYHSTGHSLSYKMIRDALYKCIDLVGLTEFKECHNC